MEATDRTRLFDQLKVDEGCVLHAYTDSVGLLTIGIGRMIDAKNGGGITMDEALYLFQNDLAKVDRQLSAFEWYRDQDSVRQAALCNCCFNLGINGLLHFPHFLSYMAEKDYANAIGELTNTPWHRQVGVRADRIIKLIETGSWPT